MLVLLLPLLLLATALAWLGYAKPIYRSKLAILGLILIWTGVLGAVMLLSIFVGIVVIMLTTCDGFLCELDVLPGIMLGGVVAGATLASIATLLTGKKALKTLRLQAQPWFSISLALSFLLLVAICVAVVQFFG